MDLKNLYTFYYVTVFSSFTKAANFLKISQPAVTAQISKLENDLEAELFIRGGRRIHLTPEGLVIEQYAKEIFDLVDKMESEVREIQKTSNRLIVAADINFLTSTIPYVLNTYYLNNPNVEVQLNAVENSKKIFSGVESGQYDVGIVSGEYYLPTIEMSHLSSDPIILVSSKDVGQKLKVSDNWEQMPVIVYDSDSSYSGLLLSYLKKHNLFHHRFIRFNSLEAVKSSVLHNIGIAVLTEDVVENELKNGDIVRLDDIKEPMEIPTFMSYLKTKKNWVSIREFENLLLENKKANGKLPYPRRPEESEKRNLF